MEMSEYLVESARTCAKAEDLQGDLVSMEALREQLTAFRGAGQWLDTIKKAYAYGKGNCRIDPKRRYFGSTVWMIETSMESYTEGDILHAILGICTEAAELAEAVLSAGGEGKRFDKTNLKEEVGDLMWYQALLLRTLGSTFEEEAERNINKLKVRYPDKFDQEHALERDLEAERAVLE